MLDIAKVKRKYCTTKEIILFCALQLYGITVGGGLDVLDIAKVKRKYCTTKEIILFCTLQLYGITVGGGLDVRQGSI